MEVEILLQDIANVYEDIHLENLEGRMVRERYRMVHNPDFVVSEETLIYLLR
jgi:hypothetical protein